MEGQALTGDEAAISALRGLIYQEKRDGKTHAPENEDAENSIRPALPSITDPLIRKIPALRWTVHRNGTVAYDFKSGASGFIDAGEKLVFGRSLVSDDALALTLQYAAEKWGKQLRITGGDAVFKERVALMATKLGIDLLNPELKLIQTRIRPHLPAQTTQAQPGAAHSSTPRAEAIEAAVLRIAPNAQLQHAATQAKRYSGKVIAEDTQYLAQATGKGKVVLHEKASFDTTVPRIGDHVTIAYRSGKATATLRTGKQR